MAPTRARVSAPGRVVPKVQNTWSVLKLSILIAFRFWSVIKEPCSYHHQRKLNHHPNPRLGAWGPVKICSNLEVWNLTNFKSQKYFIFIDNQKLKLKSNK